MKHISKLGLWLVLSVASACADDDGSSNDEKLATDYPSRDQDAGEEKSSTDESEQSSDEGAGTEDPKKKAPDYPAQMEEPASGKDPIMMDPADDDPAPKSEWSDAGPAMMEEAGLGSEEESDGGSKEVVAMARGADRPPELGSMIDRAGRPAISTALISTFEADAAKKGAAKDAYNAASPANWSDFAGAIAGSLAILDSLDATCGNQSLAAETGDRYATLAGILADDQLYVNSASGQCGTYLGVEGEVVGAIEPGEGGCGGRTPLDDVIERSYSVLAAGVLVGVDDTITSDGQNHQIDAFPFLAAPNK